MAGNNNTHNMENTFLLVKWKQRENSPSLSTVNIESGLTLLINIKVVVYNHKTDETTITITTTIIIDLRATINNVVETVEVVVVTA
jgi:hypothetical protein